VEKEKTQKEKDIDYIKEVALRLISLLEKRKITRQDACKGAGITRGSITNWSNGNVPSVDRVVKIARYLNISLNWLLIGENPDEITNDQREFLKKYGHLTVSALKIAIEADKRLSEEGKKAALPYLKILEQDYPKGEAAPTGKKKGA
jgi:transcriptional regulator with XRE-family HTH domain